MKYLLAICLVAASLSPPQAREATISPHWPHWRGPLHNGVAPQGDPPLTWSEKHNLRWKADLPGQGHASPIIWDDRLFITTAAPHGPAAAVAADPADEDQPSWRRGNKPTRVLAFDLMAFNRHTGQLLWRRTARTEKPHEGTHTDGTWASNSSTTDGQHIYAYFGSRGLYCYTMDGDLVWERDLGDMQTRHAFGEGSSPALYGDKIALLWDHEGASAVFVLDKSTGATVWRAERDEATSWATPLVVQHQGRPQLITSATTRIRSYDLETGDVLWHSSGMTANVVPTPVHADGLVYFLSGFRGAALQAVDLARATGDIAGGPAVSWTYDRDTPYVPSPLLYDGSLYFFKGNKGILSCLNAQTGVVHYNQQRLEGLKGVYASPAAAARRVYLTGRNGVVQVIKSGPQYELLATNTLDDSFDASPALVGDALYLRGHKSLYCLAEQSPAEK